MRLLGCLQQLYSGLLVPVSNSEMLGLLIPPPNHSLWQGGGQGPGLVGNPTALMMGSLWWWHRHNCYELPLLSEAMVSSCPAVHLSLIASIAQSIGSFVWIVHLSGSGMLLRCSAWFPIFHRVLWQSLMWNGGPYWIWLLLKVQTIDTRVPDIVERFLLWWWRWSSITKSDKSLPNITWSSKVHIVHQADLFITNITYWNPQFQNYNFSNIL